MRLDLARIPPEGARFTGEEPAAVLELDDEAALRAESPVRYDLRAQLVSDRLLVQGSVAVDVSLMCSRCTNFFSSEVQEASFEHVAELDDALEFVDLTEEIRESIVLNFPAHPVCSSECKGLCPQCGANLNKEHCDCRPPDDSRWHALDGLQRLQ